jgi:hypothetical protein
MKFRFLLSMIFLAALGANAGAEVEKFIQIGDGQLRPYFRLKFTPPVGWAQDPKATQENGMPIYVPKGKTFGDAPALMYIRVSYNADKRANGKVDFQIYHFVNPSKPQQAYELMAYGEDADKDGNSYFLMIALTAAAQKAIDSAEADYRAGLRAH